MLASLFGASRNTNGASLEIKTRLGYKDFDEQPEKWRLLRWLYERAWLTAERSFVLFDLTTARLVDRKIILPGVTTLARLVASVRDRAENRLWKILSSLPSHTQIKNLEGLLLEEGGRQTKLDRLRHGPTRFSAPAQVAALERLLEVRNIGVGTIDLSRLPAGRVRSMARIASGVRAQTISRMSDERQIATLLSFAHVMEETAQDDALDVLNLLVADLLRHSENEGKKDRLRTLKSMDEAALQLCKACEVLLDFELNDADVRSIIFSAMSEIELEQALLKVLSIARPPDDNYYQELLNKWRTVRRFLPLLLSTIEFRATEAAKPVLDALLFLKSIEGSNKPNMAKAPTSIVQKGWRRMVFDHQGTIDRHAYTFCVLENLRDSLRSRDIFVAPSARWADPRAKLLQGEAWTAARPQVARALNLKVTPDDELAELKQELADAYSRVAANLPNNAFVRIEQENGKDVLVLSPLDALDEPGSLIELREDTKALLPLVDITEVLLEINARTGFAKAFTHLSEAGSRVDDLDMSVCAVLVAEACNIGLEPLVNQKVPALTRDRLLHVSQNYLRIDTITKSNACLVEAQSKLPLAQLWGGGEVASADGIRFIVPVRTINAGPNPKYFGVGRGVTYYNFTSDQFTGFHGIAVPGTVRDSLYVLDGLLEQQTCLQPTEIMTDTHGYTDIVFGLFWLLGYQFSPRLADLGESRFWRIDKEADYGGLNDISRNVINANLIAQNWDDLLRVAGTLKSGKVSASEFMRTLRASSRPSALSKALAELGRVAKTLYLLNYIDDETYRRRILTQLNRQEGRHSVARATFHGQRGELRQRYREGQEDQLGALGLVVNVITLWNTIYLERALEHLRIQGRRIEPEDAARLSPLQHKNHNFLGRYPFALPEQVLRGEYRPLRTPEDAFFEQLL
jgi:TnpA family transposase